MLMKFSCTLAALLLLPLLVAAQTPVFKCEVDGRTVWSDSPCKGAGKVVTVKALSGQKKEGADPQDKKLPPAAGNRR